jgi:hypothetical protein
VTGRVRRLLAATVAGLAMLAATGVIGRLGPIEPNPSGTTGAPAAAEAAPPQDGLAVVRDHGVTLRYPAGWFRHDVTEVDLGSGSSYFVLTSEPFPADCDDPSEDLNCLYQHPLGPGAIRMTVGGASLDRTIFDPLPQGLPADVQVVRGTVGGMPAMGIERRGMDALPVDLSWSIAVPDSVGRALTIHATATEPGAAALRAAAKHVVDSLVLDVTPAPVPTDPAERAAAARTAKVAAVAKALADGGNVVMGDRASDALDDCFRAAIDRPATLPIEVTSDVLPTGTVQVTCTVTAELVGAAFWKITITGRSGAGSTVPGTTTTIVEWITTAGEPAGDSWGGIVPAARAPGFLTLDATGAAAVARLVTEFDRDDTDFYRCFPDAPGIGGGPIFVGPDHVSHWLGVDAVCTTAVAVRPERETFDVTLTAEWPAGDRHGPGRLIVHLPVDRDGTIHEPSIEGDPMP